MMLYSPSWEGKPISFNWRLNLRKLSTIWWPNIRLFSKKIKRKTIYSRRRKWRKKLKSRLSSCQRLKELPLKKLMMMKPRKLNSKICWKNNRKQKPKKKRIRLRVKLRRRAKVKMMILTRKKMSSKNLMQEMVDKQKNTFGIRPWRKWQCMFLYLQVSQLKCLMCNWILMILELVIRARRMSQHSLKVNGARRSSKRKVCGTLKEKVTKVPWQSQLRNLKEEIGGHLCFKVILKLIPRKLNRKIQNWVI